MSLLNTPAHRIATVQYVALLDARTRLWSQINLLENGLKTLPALHEELALFDAALTTSVKTMQPFWDEQKTQDDAAQAAFLKELDKQGAAQREAIAKLNAESDKIVAQREKMTQSKQP